MPYRVVPPPSERAAAFEAVKVFSDLSPTSFKLTVSGVELTRQ